MKRPCFFSRAFAWLVCLAGVGISTASANEVWLGGIYRPFEESGPPGPMIDFMELFKPDAPWPTASKHLAVFQTSMQVIMGVPDKDLATVFADLDRRGIALAVAMGVVLGSKSCGVGEGYNTEGAMVAMAQRVRRLGGKVAYISMDEPLWFGHYDDSPGKCREPIDQIASDVAAEVAAVKRIFPGIKVGDIEPIGNPEPKDWLDQIFAWSSAYKKAAGEPLDFIRADVDWYGPWQQQLAALARRLRLTGIKFSIIYDGIGDERTATEWAEDTEKQFASIESDQSMIPDQAVIESWTPQPKRNLPETQPGTMTNMVLRYVAQETHLALTLSGDLLTGRLVDNKGRAIGGGRIAISAVDNGLVRIPSVQTITGKVPVGASVAILGLRVNLECRCGGPADINLGELKYTESGTGNSAVRQLSTKNAPSAGSHVVATQDQKVMINSERFPVTEGENYSVTVPIEAAEGSQNSGYVTIIFVGKDGKGIIRRNVRFLPGTTSLGVVSTNTDGRFEYRLPADFHMQKPAFLATFSGSDSFRLSVARTN